MYARAYMYAHACMCAAVMDGGGGGQREQADTQMYCLKRKVLFSLFSQEAVELNAGATEVIGIV